MRYFLELAYHGAAYHGWQRQPNAVSVQEKVETALGIVTRKEIEVVGAGRTDTGVHAKQLYCHFDVEGELDQEMLFRMNSVLPKDIAAKSLQRVQPEAHARFDALSRSYEYHVVREKDPFSLGSAYFVKRDLELEKMKTAAGILMEYSDFKCFSRSRTDVKTYTCDISQAVWEENEKGLVFHIKADRFLRNMVRAIVGTLLEIGLGKLEVEDMRRVIESRSRSEAGASVPAHGLYLTRVVYPENIFLD